MKALPNNRGTEASVTKNACSVRKEKYQALKRVCYKYRGNPITVQICADILEGKKQRVVSHISLKSGMLYNSDLV